MHLFKPVEQLRSPNSLPAVPSPPTGAQAPAAVVIHVGQRIDLPDKGVTIGRDPGSDIVVTAPNAATEHARIASAEGRWFVADLDSENGTFLNGERLHGQSRWLRSGDGITVAGERLRFVVTPAEGAEHGQIELPTSKRLTVGRGPDADVQLSGPGISAVHAEIVMTDGRIEVIDRDSHGGTRVNGSVVERADLAPGYEIGIGPHRLVYDGTHLIPQDDMGALRLDADNVTVAVRDKVILDRLSLHIHPGEFVAIVGESGSGKTTTLKALAGVSRPTSGVIQLSGDPVRSRLSEIGYLPQDEIVHPRLTVLESLGYSARIRLPLDSSHGEIRDAVQHAIDSVSLEEVAPQRVSQLSGGQRKRVGLATELLTHPGILFLDEPTTGLDVGLERQMMELFRSLAEVGRHAVIVVTHATHSLDHVDRLCVMGRGGHLCFVGPPPEALEFFGVTRFEDVYTALKQKPTEEWRREFEQNRPARSALPEHVHPASPHRLRRGNPRARGMQAGILTARYLKVFTRDRVNLAILLMQAPLLALGALLLFHGNVLAPPGRGNPSAGATYVFLLLIMAVWLGAIDASREIVKERAIFNRERAVGVSIPPYLFSKGAVLFGLVVVQAAILLGLAAVARPLHESLGTHLILYGILALSGFAAVGMGLLISAVARTEDQATALIPLALISQLLFSGAIVAIKNVTGVMAALSVTSFARWAYEGAGTAVHLNERFAADRLGKFQNPYGTSFFSFGSTETLLLLVGFIAIFFGVTAFVLSRQRSG